MQAMNTHEIHQVKIHTRTPLVEVCLGRVAREKVKPEFTKDAFTGSNGICGIYWLDLASSLKSRLASTIHKWSQEEISSIAKPVQPTPESDHSICYIFKVIYIAVNCDLALATGSLDGWSSITFQMDAFLVSNSSRYSQIRPSSSAPAFTPQVN